MMAAKMPGLAAGSTTCRADCQRLAPNASAADVSERGTADIASSQIVNTIGMTAKPSAMPTMMQLRWS
jgi:hypothetical protein